MPPSVPQCATLPIPPAVLQERSSVTWDTLQRAAGWVTPACQRALSVLPCPAMNPWPLSAQPVMLGVTLALMMDVGWETTACLRGMSVLLHVTILHLLSVERER